MNMQTQQAPNTEIMPTKALGKPYYGIHLYLMQKAVRTHTRVSLKETHSISSLVKETELHEL